MDRHGLVCRTVLEQPDITQREMAQKLKVSLGTVNGLIKECIGKGYIAERTDGGGGSGWELTGEGRRLLEGYKVDGALIIAAGFGSRFVPLTFETPKGLLEVFGERMIERQICQLHEAGITDITIAVGYLKEKFEYLMDKYDVKLLYNPEYSDKNTLATIYRSRKVLKGRNMYVLASDNWMRENMYHAYECGAWYSAAYQDGETKEWCLSFNKRGRITDVKIGGRDQWVMYGPAYFSREFSARFLPVLEAYYKSPGTEQFYWEQVYVDMLSGEARRRLEQEDGELLNEAVRASGLSPAHWDEIEMDANRQPDNQVYEFENLEELRLFDPRYQNHSDNAAMKLVAEVFKVPESQIKDIRCLKSGMTNKSFLFKVGERHCICRIPGPGTELLINRKQEKQVYDAVACLGITEHVIYMNDRTGYKIAEYYEGARNADASDWSDMDRCMEMVRRLHQSGITVGHDFDIRERIDFYEKLCSSHGGILFEDYQEVRGWMDWLMDRMDAMDRPKCLSHIDANVDNFLFLGDGGVKLLDWEYAGMCDPIMDVSMCAIYSYYDEADMEKLLAIYLQREPTKDEYFAVYAYAALGGFLWSLWAVYKSALGDEFGEYTIIMYRYAKKYYRKLRKL
ncbi:phosphocholine cytidylyltransferase/choline kinase family protein [Enterocloster sp. OA13]|uniref:phosphotransferase n=1 Tax=Enterocloster sp. OA13 TaxID=2914161 RepID=UPI00046FDE96|nr:phosphocholine cytidylyltransferase/choline kinase family protein [Enterocloster sp. OA13]